MSINSSLSSALSGLSVAARRAEIVASNIANAATPGYGRRVLQIGARTTGTHGYGVAVTGVTRVVDMRVIGQRRLADSDAGSTSTLASFYKALELKIGSPDEPQSLNGRVAMLNQSFLEATSHPESEARLDKVASSAKALASTLKSVSDAIQGQRVAADSGIANQVQQLNDALNRVADLNSQIRDNSGAGSDPSSLMDQRQQLIDSIAAIVPLREYDRGNGQIALMTSGGQMLVDGGVAKIEFTPVGVISPAMTLQSGALSALMIDGRAVDAVGDNSPIAGGSLAALFKVRDVDGVDAQTRVDAVARDLVERFQDPSLDATRIAGDPGLFTDGNAVFNPANPVFWFRGFANGSKGVFNTLKIAIDMVGNKTVEFVIPSVVQIAAVYRNENPYYNTSLGKNVKIHIGPGFFLFGFPPLPFGAIDGSPSMAGILIHEFSHITLGTGDQAYRFNGVTMPLLGAPISYGANGPRVVGISEPLKNADNYRLFVRAGATGAFGLIARIQRLIHV